MLHFSGNQALTSSNTYTNTGSATTAFVVMRRTADTTNYARSLAFIGPSSNTDYNSTSNWCIDNNSNGSSMYIERSAGHNQGALPAVNTVYLAEVVFDGTNCTTYVNGTSLGTAFSSTGNFNINQMVVGSGFNNGAAPFCPLTGDIGEIVVYNRALNTSEMQSIENYLTQKWGISTPPPAGGPPVSGAQALVRRFAEQQRAQQQRRSGKRRPDGGNLE